MSMRVGLPLLVDLKMTVAAVVVLCFVGMGIRPLVGLVVDGRDRLQFQNDRKRFGNRALNKETLFGCGYRWRVLRIGCGIKFENAIRVTPCADRRALDANSSVSDPFPISDDPAVDRSRLLLLGMSFRRRWVLGGVAAQGKGKQAGEQQGAA